MLHLFVYMSFSTIECRNHILSWSKLINHLILPSQNINQQHQNDKQTTQSTHLHKRPRNSTIQSTTKAFFRMVVTFRLSGSSLDGSH